MTVTDMEVDNGAETVVPGFTIAAHTLRDMLTGALLAVGKDGSLPTLECVRLEWDGAELRAVSTDRYRLMLVTVRAQGTVGYSAETNLFAPNDVGNVMLHRSELSELVKALPKIGKRGVPESVRFTVLGDTVLVEGEGWSRNLTIMVGDFPKYRSLIPTEDMFGAVDMVAYNPKYLADIGKIPGEKNVPVRFRFTEANRPMVATLEGANGVSEYLYLLMPVRVTG